MEVVGEAEVTPEWLSGVLRRAGALDAGDVAAIQADAAGASWSRNLRLRVRYSPGARGDCPERLFLKICAGEQAVFGRSEVDFYTRDYVGLPDPPLPRCYGAAYRDAPRAYILLLEDLSETHTDAFRVDPDLRLGEGLAESLATLHAARWGPDGLAGIGARLPGEAEIARYFDWVGRGVAPLFDVAGDALDRTGRALVERVFAWHPAAMRRRAGRSEGFTWVHGDTNPGNLLIPRNWPGRVHLIDRQPFDWSLQVWLGASDLAIWLVLHMDEAPRRCLEQPVLRAYHRALGSAGIAVPFDAILWDYRFSIAQCLELAVEWCVLPEDRERMRWLWERQLRRCLAAWAELDCETLLREG